MSEQNRKPLAVGNEYGFGPMYPSISFKVTSVQLPGRPGFDGGAAGVAVKWNLPHRGNQFYLVSTEPVFWGLMDLRGAVDLEVEE